MRRLVLLLLLMAGAVYGQQNNNTLRLYIDNDFGDEQRMLCTLYLNDNDEVIAATNLNDGPDVWKIDSIAPGYYRLHVQVDGRLIAQFFNIQVKPGYTNYYSFTIPEYYNDTIEPRDPPGKPELVFNTLYGNNQFLETQRKKDQQFIAGMAFVQYFPFSWYSFGQEFGTTAGYTQFLNDTATRFGQHVKSEYYLNLNVHYGLINRFTLYNNNHYGTDGLKLDLGVVYNLPIIFREYQRLDSRRLVEDRHICHFNDFYALARIGYKYVGLQAECNLTTFLKAGYTEAPKYRAGLVFYFSKYLTN